MTAVLLVFFVVIVEIRLGIVNGTLHRKQVPDRSARGGAGSFKK